MLQPKTKVAFSGLILSFVAGCAAMPGNGPDWATVLEYADAASRVETPTLGYDYALVDITSDIIPFVTQDVSEASATFGISSDVIPEIRLGVGDIIQLTVFESEAGGLFIPREAGVRPGNFVELPPQEIGRNGKITVPYAGDLTAAGQTPETLEANVESRLEGLAIEPQVTVTMLERNFARASVIGAVEEPGKFVVRTGGDRILDFISIAGGITSEEHSTFVSFTRGGSSVTIPYNTLTGNPRENIYVAPGDTINVASAPKKFYVFGASGVGEYDFNDAQIDLRAALSQAAGLNDRAADPSQVLIYRTEHREALNAMGVDTTNLKIRDEAAIPTVYRADFRKPDSFFMASNFQVRDGDMVYVTNARAVELGKFFDVIRTVTGNSAAIDADFNTLTR
jgi:polysaccharide export outer membrane protein